MSCSFACLSITNKFNGTFLCNMLIHSDNKTILLPVTGLVCSLIWFKRFRDMNNEPSRWSSEFWLFTNFFASSGVTSLSHLMLLCYLFWCYSLLFLVSLKMTPIDNVPSITYNIVWNATVDTKFAMNLMSWLHKISSAIWMKWFHWNPSVPAIHSFAFSPHLHPGRLGIHTRKSSCFFF